MARFNKKLLLALAFSACFASLVLIPAVQGYGTSSSSAEAISNGTVDQSLGAYEYYAFYKINCGLGNSLYITLSYYSGDNLDLYLTDPSGSQVGSSTYYNSIDSISHTTMMMGYYTIRVYRESGSGSSAPIHMVVSGANSSVPGYDIGIVLVVVFAASALGLVIVKKKSKVVTE